MQTRTATASWSGNLKGGNGQMSFGEFTGPYTFASRFETGPGTNPEELLGAAHAGCFSMALSNMLAEAGFTPDSVNTTAEVTLEGSGISGIQLVCDADVPGIEAVQFREIAEQAKNGCPVSRALAATPIELTASLRT
jgi:osmotically inducible protein OsmC